jgi:signal peptidase II
MKKIKKKIIFVSLIVIFSVLIDQASKIVAFIQKDKIGDGIQILDFFNIVYVENRGISFGIFSSLDASFYLGILSFLISGYIIFIIKLTKEFWEIFGLSLILGGAIGNGLDRVINNYVIDFLDFYINDYHWPAFNFADSFITVGGIIFFWRIFFKKPLKK